MDATMVAMRLASEQYLVTACLSSVEASQSVRGKDAPSMEALMTLFWATSAISKEEMPEQSKLDVATEVRQACDEVNELFRQRKMPKALMERSTDVLARKSLEVLRLARS